MGRRRYDDDDYDDRRRSSSSKRSSSSRSNGSSKGRSKSRKSTPSAFGGKKSDAEARIERVTWFLMVLVFGVIYVLPEGAIPNAFIPFSGAVILLGSGLYQYGKRWRVSPTTWIAGTGLLLGTFANFTVLPNFSMYGITLLTFAAVIGIGLLTNET
ncbi:MAG: hypothetical protein SH821_15790 [Phototrophicales bacterium]|nr:hypothetical protein [Phototrophicales bacterium]